MKIFLIKLSNFLSYFLIIKYMNGKSYKEYLLMRYFVVSKVIIIYRYIKF